MCKLDDPTNLSSHDAIIGTIQIDEPKVDDDSDFSNTYEEFIPKKIIWKDNLPALAEMSSNMIVMSAEKCFQFKQSKKPQKKQTLRFSKALKDAYSNHRRICAEWRKAGRPCAAEHPAKAAKLNSQRLIQKLSRDEESDKAKTQHEELMDTHNKNISDVYKKLKKINGDTVKSSDIKMC